MHSPSKSKLAVPTIDTTPGASDLWEGIAGHFDSFTQVICEFVDNSISNFEAHNLSTRSVRISIEPCKGGKLSVEVEDTGAGVADLEPVMRLGDRSVRETPLNEHGFGLKHALASANPDNDEWIIFSRTQAQFEANLFTKLSAPYEYKMQPVSVHGKWPGKFNGPGTMVSFTCSEILFNTVQKGIKGKAGFGKCLDYLCEELGHVYAGVIEAGKTTISVTGPGGYSKAVSAVKPQWVDYYHPGSGDTKFDLGGGNVLIRYEFGEMAASNYAKHYKRNMETSGVEIRINGRLLMGHLFSEIWQIEEHPSYNHFLAIIDLVSSNRDALPKTRTSKNGIRSGDEKLEKLFEWIKNTHPKPEKNLAGAIKERELVEELAKQKEKHIRSTTKHIEVEFEVFTSVGSAVPVDLYVFDGKDVILYEAKKDNADVQDLYQLAMYWDGAVADGKTPAEGVLLAATFSAGVDAVMDWLNQREDAKGNKYSLVKKTWHAEGITYPKP